MYLNPDHYLETDSGRVFTAERNAVAWQQLYADLFEALKERPRQIIMVIGVQGAGKSTWARNRQSDVGDPIYVDYSFATRRSRSRIIEIAKAAGVQVSVVWIRVSLETALSRNRGRQADEVVPDDAVKNVFNIFEPPSLSEGFQEVVVVEDELRDATETR
jgi:predicted kinase